MITLIVGPQGSGKTTIAYGMLNSITPLNWTEVDDLSNVNFNFKGYLIDDVINQNKLREICLLFKDKHVEVIVCSQKLLNPIGVDKYIIIRN